jgi:hypothetical protein
MAAALEAYWKVASDYRDALTGVGGFDVALIDEALSLVGALRVRSGEATYPRLQRALGTPCRAKSRCRQPADNDTRP